LAGTIYEITYTGIAFTGAESPQAPIQTFTTAVADPRNVPSLGVSNVNFITGVRSVTFTFLPGPSTIQRYNLRLKCQKPSGHPYVVRRTWFRPGRDPVSRTLVNLFSASICRARLRFFYFDESSSDNAEPRKGPKMTYRNIVIG